MSGIGENREMFLWIKRAQNPVGPQAYTLRMKVTHCDPINCRTIFSS